MAPQLKVIVIGDTKNYAKALNSAAGATSKFGKSFGGTVAQWAKGALVFAGVGAAVAGVSKVVHAGIGEWQQSAQMTAQTGAVLKSTGQAAHVTAQQVDELATSLLEKTGIDDEAIKSGENMLLTFTNVRNEVGKGNDIFNQATEAVTNMAVAMNDGAVPSSEQMSKTAILVGKALNDPIRGMTALRRVGVSFTEAQQKQIKTLVDSGHAMDAQKLIIAELTKEFGKSGEMLGKSLPGQINKAKEQFNNLAGDLVGHLAPAFNKGLGAVNDFLTKLEQAPTAGAKVKVVLTAVADTAQTVFNTVKSALGKVDWAKVWSEIKITTSGLTERFKKALGDADWSSIGKGIGEAIRKTIQFSDQLAKDLSRELADAARKVNWRAFAQGLVDGLMGSSLSDKLKSALLTNFKLMNPVGLAVSTGLGKKMAGGLGDAFGGQSQKDIPAQAGRLKTALESAGRAASAVAAAQGSGIGNAMAGGIGAALYASVQAVASAALALINGVIAQMNAALGIRSPSKVTAEKVGKPMAEGIIVGFTSVMATRGAEFAAPLRTLALKLAAEIPGMRATLTTAFRTLANDILSAFDEVISNWVPPSQRILDKMQLEDQINAAVKAVADAQTAIDQAQAQLDADLAKGPQEGESQADYQARIEADKQAIAEAVTQRGEAERSYTELQLQLKAQQEQEAHDKQMAADREHLAGQLLQLQTYLAQHPGEYEKVNKKIIALMKRYHIPMYVAGQLLASKFADGLKDGIAEVIKEARRLADALERITGPVSGSGSRSTGRSGGGSATNPGTAIGGGHGAGANVTVHVHGDVTGQEVVNKVRTALQRTGQNNALDPLAVGF